MAESLNILFTSVGRRVELMRAFRQAYQSLDLSGNIVATDIDPLAPALQVVDCPALVPRLDDPAHLPDLIRLCQQEDVRLIFPLIDPDIPYLAQHRAEIEAKTNAQVIVINPEAAAKTADKWLTTQFFQQIGLPTPASWLPETIDWQQATYPLFIKPRFGSASQNTFKVRSEAELRFFINYIKQPIIQEYLPGPEITNDVVCDWEGQPLGVVSRERLQVRGGEVNKGVTIFDEAITAACLKIAESLPARGCITAQCLMKEGQPYFTEINARFGGGLPLGIAAGADSPRWLLAHGAGLRIDRPAIGAYTTGLRLSRFDDSFWLSETDVNQMRVNHV